MWRFWRKQADDTISDRLATLSRRLDDTESAVRTLKGEWLDTLDRIERMLGRIVKRASRDLAALPPGEPPAPSPEVQGNGAWDEVAARRSRGVGPAGSR